MSAEHDSSGEGNLSRGAAPRHPAGKPLSRLEFARWMTQQLAELEAHWGRLAPPCAQTPTSAVSRRQGSA